MKIGHVAFTNLTTVVVITLVLLISTTVFASSEDAKSKVKTVFNQVETSLIALKQDNALTKIRVREVLTKVLLPEVDTRYFTYKVLNKNMSKVPDELKEQFINELSLQLISTYSNLLNKYNNEVIKIGQSSLSQSGKMAMVDISIVGKTNNAVVKLLLSNAKEWLFFDIEIEGISLLQTKQGEINTSFNKLGIEGTLAHLRKINQKVADD